MENKSEKMTEKEVKVSAEAAAFLADLELAEYRHRVETGDLTEEEKEDRKAVLDFLGYSDSVVEKK